MAYGKVVELFAVNKYHLRKIINSVLYGLTNNFLVPVRRCVELKSISVIRKIERIHEYFTIRG